MQLKQQSSKNIGAIPTDQIGLVNMVGITQYKSDRYHLQKINKLQPLKQET